MLDAQNLKSKAQQRGFTLVEIAIVLVIIALIMTAVLKAKGVMDKAKSNELNQMMQELDVACDLYKDKKGIYPSGNSTGVDNSNSTGFFEAMYDEELITSDDNQHAFEGNVRAWYECWNSTASSTTNSTIYGNLPNNTWQGSLPDPVNFLTFTKVPPGYARLADDLYDDANSTTGMVRADSTYDNATIEYLTVFYNLDG
jgi:prepilin-type N-terminal cleavage/methylation domain-containing protein